MTGSFWREACAFALCSIPQLQNTTPAAAAAPPLRKLRRVVMTSPPFFAVRHPGRARLTGRLGHSRRKGQPQQEGGRLVVHAILIFGINVKPLKQKYFAFVVGQIISTTLRYPVPLRGASA